MAMVTSEKPVRGTVVAKAEEVAKLPTTVAVADVKEKITSAGFVQEEPVKAPVADSVAPLAEYGILNPDNETLSDTGHPGLGPVQCADGWHGSKFPPEEIAMRKLQGWKFPQPGNPYMQVVKNAESYPLTNVGGQQYLQTGARGGCVVAVTSQKAWEETIAKAGLRWVRERLSDGDRVDGINIS